MCWSQNWDNDFKLWYQTYALGKPLSLQCATWPSATLDQKWLNIPSVLVQVCLVKLVIPYVRLGVLCVSPSLTHHVSEYWAVTPHYTLAWCTTHILWNHSPLLRLYLCLLQVMGYSHVSCDASISFGNGVSRFRSNASRMYSVTSAWAWVLPRVLAIIMWFTECIRTSGLSCNLAA